MVKKEMVFHPDLQNKEREPVSDIWKPAVDQVNFAWMKDKKLSRRALLVEIASGAGVVATLGFGGWFATNGQPSQDVFPDGKNHSPFQTGSERNEQGQQPQPRMNPTPQKEK